MLKSGKRVCNMLTRKKRSIMLAPKKRVNNMLSQKKRVIFNICGEVFETYEDTLSRFPETLLGNRKTRDVYYCSKRNQHFFDRNRLCFEAILYFYQSNGRLNCLQGGQFPIFEEECRYFEITDEIINNMKSREGIIYDLNEHVTFHGKLPLQIKIWNILENPNTSYAARIFGVFSLCMVWLSIITASLETLQRYRLDSRFVVIEVVLNIWFLTELIFRLIFSKSKLEFVQASMNWVDAFAVIPFFLLAILQSKENSLLGIFKTLKFMRIIRLFRLSKHSRRLKVVGIILISCLGNFKLLMMCLIMVIFLGGSFIYFAEGYTNHIGFTSVLQGLWWGVQTITPVGYGDLIPMTVIGKTFACCFMLFGVLTISLPVLTIVSQFTTIYPKNVECEMYIKQHEINKEKLEENINKKHEAAITRSSITILL